MAHTRRALVLIAVIGTAAGAAETGGEGRLSKLLAGKAPGKPAACISQTPSLDSTTIDGVGILYRRGGTFYLNRFGGDGCHITQSDFIVTTTPTTQLCRGDIARIVDSSTRMPHGSCIYGDFTPYAAPSR